jgi:Flp pilus assembly protein TadG
MIHRTGKSTRERGFVIYVWAIMMFFIILPMIGLAIDCGILFFIKSKLQTAVDGAALGAARSLSRGQDIPSQEAAATDTAKRYYHANFPVGWMGVSPVADPTVTWPAAPPATAIISVQGDVNAPTWFMHVLGWTSVHLTVVGQSTRRNVNVMLVLDRSGSLETDGNCTPMAQASTFFVQSFSNNRDRMGMVTFGTDYNVDFAPSYTFQTGLTNMLVSLNCTGWTNSAAAFSKGYQQLKGLGDLNALNVILFFTDGAPNTITFGTADGGTGPLLPLKSGSSCKSTPGFSGTVGGNADGIYQQTVATYPAPNVDQVLIGASGGNNGGCSFDSGINRTVANDVSYLPNTDVFGNSLNTSLLGGSPFPYSVSTSSGKIQVTSSNVTNAGINALDNAAQNARVDALANNIPFLCYTVGLGSVNDELLRRIANDPTAAAHQVAYANGIYVNSPDAAHLNSAFATIASDLLRLSK